MIHSFKCKDCKDTIKDNHTLKQLYLMKSFRTKNLLILITSKITFEKTITRLKWNLIALLINLSSPCDLIKKPIQSLSQLSIQPCS